MKKAEGGEFSEKTRTPRARTKTAAAGKEAGAAKKTEEKTPAAVKKTAKTAGAKAPAQKPVKDAAAKASEAEVRAAKKIAANKVAAAKPKAAPKAPAAKASGKRGAGKGPAPADLARIVASAAAEHKLINPVLLDLSGLSSVADWFFIATAENARQMGAIADKIIRRVREHGLRPLGREGQTSAQWALVDLGDVIVHLFSPEARELYDLEGLWADAVRLKV